MFVEHPLLRREAIEEREYQTAIARSCLERSTLVVLPTGMGKTVVAALVIADVIRTRGGRILLLAPTKPLVEQHARFLNDVLLLGDAAVFTGETPPADRELEWRERKIVCSTPQVIENDLRAGRIGLEDVSLVIFDEAHRAVGDYAYVDVARLYRETRGLSLGMTASPGSEVEKILEVCDNLGISAVEIRTEFDPDVAPYVHDTQVERIRVDVTATAGRIRDLLRAVLDEQIDALRRLGYFADGARVTTRDLLAVGKQVRAALDGGRKSGPAFRAAFLQAYAMKLNHAIELVETQGLEAFLLYVERIREGKEGRSSKADRAFLAEGRVSEAIALAGETGDRNPKITKTMFVLREQFAKNPDSRVIVFTHYRDTATAMERVLAGVPGLRPVRFVGQSSRGGDIGLSQKEQVEILDKFRAGEYNVVVATSVAEEGLDVPQVDLVVFFEPVPSEIRTIQRRGRTGRRYAGRVAMLVTKDTRDEAYFYSAKRKERKMHAELDRLRRDLRQRIFVGSVEGDTLVSEDPAKRIESMRERAREKEEVPRRKPERQADLSDF